jgi:hypothetical protein
LDSNLRFKNKKENREEKEKEKKKKKIRAWAQNHVLGPLYPFSPPLSLLVFSMPRAP